MEFLLQGLQEIYRLNNKSDMEKTRFQLTLFAPLSIPRVTGCHSSLPRLYAVAVEFIIFVSDLCLAHIYSCVELVL